MYKAILFDLDGTLTESGEGITKCVQYALEKLGRPESDLEKLKVFIGPPLMEQFMKYADLDEATARKAVEYYRERYSTTGIFENRPYPGVEKMLQELRRKKYLLAVASSKPEYYVKQILDYFNLKEYFDEIVGSEMNGARTNKTEVIEETLKRLGLDHHREQVIMVGDKEHDVLGARKAGLDCVAVSYGYGTEEELAASQPLQIVASAEEILDFFRLSPRRRQSHVRQIWRVAYPCGIHFLISQVIGYAGLWLIMKSGGGMDAYYQNAILFTGLTGLLAMIPCLWFYSRDRAARKIGGLVTSQKPWQLKIPEMLLLLGMGAAFSQFANMLVGILQSVLNYQEYQESMDQLMEGKQMWFLILSMGIIAPLAEEIVFRWLIYLRLRDYMRMGAAAVISGLIFGIYHGNLVQAVYASLLGIVFAYILDISGCLWSSVLLHMGANIWSLISPDLYTWIIARNSAAIMILFLILLMVMILGCFYFTKRVQGRSKRVI